MFFLPLCHAYVHKRNKLSEQGLSSFSKYLSGTSRAQYESFIKGFPILDGFVCQFIRTILRARQQQTWLRGYTVSLLYSWQSLGHGKVPLCQPSQGQCQVSNYKYLHFYTQQSSYTFATLFYTRCSSTKNTFEKKIISGLTIVKAVFNFIVLDSRKTLEYDMLLNKYCIQLVTLGSLQLQYILFISNKSNIMKIKEW